MKAKRWPVYHRQATTGSRRLRLGFISDLARIYFRESAFRPNTTPWHSHHRGALIRIGSFGPSRLIGSRSVKRPPHIEEQA